LLESLNYTGIEVQPEVLHLLHCYNWPGNVRELKNVLERGLMLSGGDILKPSHFASLNPQAAEGRSATIESSIEVAEMLHIKGVMDQCGGDTSAAAKVLGISRPTLYRKVKRYNIINK
jgi:transcriptional regulator of acetoin/glycerol metabolism